ncbi:hypothetical protein [Clostridium pasteurianum]|uniref:Uncharacterized protein n=1 Tax=Clostridium pasteurianum BC1 TaxID=86416 RepID=R4KDB2_CLOPA|nr:hypothetical protein [Clostridium pasteurianum]AGK97610.1 hypothetical protein Clopa_2771 [Clostridium pasteurianum BC1]
MVFIGVAVILGLIQIGEYAENSIERMKYLKVAMLFLVIGLSLAKYFN